MAASERVSRRDLGLAPMAPPEAFKALEQLLDHAGSEASVLSIRSWKAFFAAHPREQHDPFFVQLRGADGAGASIRTETSNFTHQLKLLSADACRPALLDHLRAQAAKVLRSDPSDYIPGGLPLQERGLDSLMSVELRNLLVKSLGLPLPATLLLDYPTLDGVCEYLLSQHFAPATATPDWSDDSDDFASLSEAEAEVLLKQELESLDV
jgi:acyl carrier protein